MKRRNIAIFALVLFATLQFSHLLFAEEVKAKTFEQYHNAADNSFVVFYEKINDALYHKKFEQLLSILSVLDSFHAASFGNGLGPTDKNSFQLIVLQIIQNLFFDANGELNIPEIKGEITKNEKEWLEKLSIEPKDSNNVIDLLQNKQVAIRWLGIAKTNYTTPSTKVAKILQQIVLDDSYVIIAGKPFIISNKINDLPDNGMVGKIESNFSCPLREKAYRVLNKWGYKIDIDTNSINRRGIYYLASLYNNSDNPILKKQIIDTISLFSHNNSAIVLLFSDKTFDKEYQNAIDAFKNAIGSKRNYHVY